MDSMVEIYLERADTEFMAAESLKRLSEQEKAKADFGLPHDATFYSSVISHSYYSIFYAAKAMLLTRGIRTWAPEVHRKTYDAFEKHFVMTGILDKKLLEIYDEAMVRASDLLGIFRGEKRKRGDFTYKIIPQANRNPADESLANAKVFVSNIRKVVGSAGRVHRGLL